MQDAAKSTPGQCKNIRASFPSLAVNPGVDSWKMGRPTEGVPLKKTWQIDRVLKDVEHRMQSFTEHQQDQWRALFQFHRLYSSADALPSLPIHLSAPSGATYSMNVGAPVDWDASWRSLAWRFYHPHRPRNCDATASAADAPSSSTYAADSTTKPYVPVELINNVTGGNASKLSKKHRYLGMFQ